MKSLSIVIAAALLTRCLLAIAGDDDPAVLEGTYLREGTTHQRMIIDKAGHVRTNMPIYAAMTGEYCPIHFFSPLHYDDLSGYFVVGGRFYCHFPTPFGMVTCDYPLGLNVQSNSEGLETTFVGPAYFGMQNGVCASYGRTEFFLGFVKEK